MHVHIVCHVPNSNIHPSRPRQRQHRPQDFFREARAAYLKEQRQAVDAERRSATQQLQAKQEEIEILKDELAVARNGLQDKDLSLWKAVSQISKLTEQSRGLQLLRKMFLAWRGHIEWEKREALLIAKADTWSVPRSSGA